MKYSIGINFDKELIIKIKKLLESRDLPLDTVDFFGCNPAFKLDLPRGNIVDNNTFEEYVNFVHEQGFTFIYLFNNPCIDEKTLNNGIQQVKKLGVKQVTIATKATLDTFEKLNLPGVKINISTIFRLDSIEKTKPLLEYKSINKVIISHSLNHDLGKTKVLSEFLQEKNITAEVVGNEMIVCDSACPECFSYKDFTTKKDGDRGTKKFGKYGCCGGWDGLNYLLKNNLTTYIKPENVHFYRELGIDRLKLATRGLQTPHIYKIFKSYINESHDGNIMDLMEDLRFDLHKTYVSNTHLKTKIENNIISVDASDSKQRDIFIRYFSPKGYYTSEGNSQLHIQMYENRLYDGNVTFTSDNSSALSGNISLNKLIPLNFLKKKELLDNQTLSTLNKLFNISAACRGNIQVKYHGYDGGYSMMFDFYNDEVKQLIMDYVGDIFDSSIFDAPGIVSIGMTLGNDAPRVFMKTSNYKIRKAQKYVSALQVFHEYSPEGLENQKTIFVCKSGVHIHEIPKLFTKFKEFRYLESNDFSLDSYNINLVTKDSSLELRFP